MNRFKFDDSSIAQSQSRQSEGKRKRREALILRAVAEAANHTFGDVPVLSGVFVSRVEMSKKSGLCHLFFGVIGADAAHQEKVLAALNKLKGALRSLIAQALEGAWCPEIVIEIDTTLDKVWQVNQKICETLNESSRFRPVDEVVAELSQPTETKIEEGGAEDSE